jgi:hypothetical protein
MVRMRSLGEMNQESAFSRVVFPAPVPPDTMIFSLAFTPASSSRIMPRVKANLSTRSSGIRRSLPKRRIDSSAPSTASGGMMALTREPSLSRASTMGLDSSTRRPTWETILSMMRSRWPSS